MIMASANDLIIVFLGLEILSIALYVLAAMNSRRDRVGRGGAQVLRPRRVLVGGLPLRHRPGLRRRPARTNLIQIADYLARNVPLHNGLLLAGLALLLVGFGFKVAAVPVPPVDARRLPGLAHAGGRVHGRGGQGGRLRRPAAGVRVVVRRCCAPTGGRPCGCSPRSRCCSARWSPWSSATSSACSPTRRSTPPGSSSSACRRPTPAAWRRRCTTCSSTRFMVIGSFAVVSVVGGRGDDRHDLERYRGLAARQPWLAGRLALFLLAQAGIPFTTGFLAKLEVITAVGGRARPPPWPSIAMVTAAIAAFFYLRVVVLMYAPLADTAADDYGRRGRGRVRPEPGARPGREPWPVRAPGRRGGGGGHRRRGRRAAPRLRRRAPRTPTTTSAGCASRWCAARPSSVCAAVTVLFGAVAGPHHRVRPQGHAAVHLTPGRRARPERAERSRR